MMNREEFMEALEPMILIFPHTPGPEQLDVYFDFLKHSNILTFKRAISHIIKTHKYKSWPAIGSFTEAINDITLASPQPTIREIENRYDQKCSICENTGWEPSERGGRFFAKYCSCPAGQALKRGHQKRKK